MKTTCSVLEKCGMRFLKTSTQRVYRRIYIVYFERNEELL